MLELRQSNAATREQASRVASTLEKDVRSSVANGANTDAATHVGKMIAERAKSAGVAQVVFDRGGYRFHGRVKALADAARESGLDF